MNAHTKMEPPGVIADMATRFGMNAGPASAPYVRRARLRSQDRARSYCESSRRSSGGQDHDLNRSPGRFTDPQKGGVSRLSCRWTAGRSWSTSNAAFDGSSSVTRSMTGQRIAITCRMYRKDRNHPIEATESCPSASRTTTIRRGTSCLVYAAAQGSDPGCSVCLWVAGIVDPDEAARVHPRRPADRSDRTSVMCGRILSLPRPYNFSITPIPLDMRPTRTAAAVANAIKGATEWPDCRKL